MIIDSHAHIYPDKIAHKAARSIGDFYDIDMSLDGTVDMLLKVGDEAGVDKFLVRDLAVKMSLGHIIVYLEFDILKKFISDPCPDGERRIPIV